MLTGIIKPTEGSINVLGYDLKEHPVKAKMLMGVVPETANPYIDMSAWDNLMLMGQLYGLDKKERKRRGDELLSLFGLFNEKKIKAKFFSKGMKQKLILAMALIHMPRLIFLDEPTSGLDVKSVRLIRQIITEYNKDGMTIFLTTHNIEEADQLCDRVAIINQGKIAAIDRPSALRAVISGSQSVEVAFGSPANDFTALSTLDFVSEVRKEGDKYRLFTEAPGKVATLVVEFASANSIEIVNLNTYGPRLEDVFVHLTEG
jgi:ABC-2 type transport system ATP-binding protein